LLLVRSAYALARSRKKWSRSSSAAVEVDVEGFAVTWSDAAQRSAIVHGRGGHTFPPPVE
jgi:hypothetical protein